MKPVIEHLRSEGIVCTVYLDDIFLIFDNTSEAKEGINKTCSFLEHLGFTINYDKCILLPEQRCKFLGFVLNSLEMTIELPPDKCLKINQVLLSFYNRKQCKISEFAHLLGLLTSACPLSSMAWYIPKLLKDSNILICLIMTITIKL